MSPHQLSRQSASQSTSQSVSQAVSHESGALPLRSTSPRQLSCQSTSQSASQAVSHESGTLSLRSMSPRQLSRQSASQSTSQSASQAVTDSTRWITRFSCLFFSPDVILSGWPGAKQQLANSLTSSFFFVLFIQSAYLTDSHCECECECLPFSPPPPPLLPTATASVLFRYDVRRRSCWQQIGRVLTASANQSQGSGTPDGRYNV